MGDNVTGIAEFTDEIDKAIDRLFDPKRMLHQDQNQADELLTYEQASAEFSNEKNAPKAAISPHNVTLFQLLDEAALTLEWEVTLVNINRVQELLGIFRNEFQSGKELKALVDLMDQLLAVMAKAPEKAHFSGPTALLQALKIVGNFCNPSANEKVSSHALSAAMQQLRNALPQPASKTTATPSPQAAVAPLKAPLPSMPADANPAFEIAGGLYSALQYHLTVLNQLTALILPVEMLFKKTAGYEKFYTILHTVRQQIDKQQCFYGNALENDYRCSSDDRTPPLPETLRYSLHSHVSILDQCVKRIEPAEKIFGKASGMEKLYVPHRRIREQLEKQSKMLARLSNGQFRSLRDASLPGKAHKEPCPFHSLLTAEWGGGTVAFVAEHVAYEGNVAWWASRSLSRQEQFPLRYLKTWPWSKLKGQFSGKLAEQREKTLSKLTVPILNSPGPFKVLNQTENGNSLLVLQYNDTQAAVFLNSDPESVSVSEQWEWEPCTEKNSIVAGYLNMDDKLVPVVSLEKITAVLSARAKQTKQLI